MTDINTTSRLAGRETPRLVTLTAMLATYCCGCADFFFDDIVHQDASPSTPTVGFYGAGINADDLGNQVIGWNPENDNCNRAAAIRIRATHSGRLSAVRTKFIFSSTSPGYNSGNGGNILVQIQTDSGDSRHVPSDTSLASLEYDAPVTAADYFPLLPFPTPADITAGELVHVVFTNVAADPKADWVFIDHLFMWDAEEPQQPTIADTDLAALERCAGDTWTPFVRGTTASHTPIIELIYDDGFAQGQGYIQGFGKTTSTSLLNLKVISGTSSVRETFTVTGATRRVSSVSVRVNRTSGSSPLAIRVEESEGALVGEGSVMVPQGVVSATHNGSSWAKVGFATPLTLVAGTRYNLVLSSPSDTVHTAHPLEEGSGYGFEPTTYFNDGFAEFNDGSGWRTWDLWGMPNRTDIDLQFYFEVI